MRNSQAILLNLFSRTFSRATATESSESSREKTMKWDNSKRDHLPIGI